MYSPGRISMRFARIRYAGSAASSVVNSPSLAVNAFVVRDPWTWVPAAKKGRWPVLKFSARMDFVSKSYRTFSPRHAWARPPCPDSMRTLPSASTSCSAVIRTRSARRRLPRYVTMTPPDAEATPVSRSNSTSASPSVSEAICNESTSGACWPSAVAMARTSRPKRVNFIWLAEYSSDIFEAKRGDG